MKLEITIPESWADVKLKNYQDYIKALKPYEGSEVYQQVLIEKAINHFCELSTEQLNRLPMENYQGLISYMNELHEQGPTLSLVKKFEIGDTKYGFIPSLDHMTYGEYLDLSTYFQDMWPNMPTIMSILYRPIVEELNETYSIQPYSGTSEDLEELFANKITMDIVWGAIGFFLYLQKDLFTGMVTYSIQSLKKMSKTDSQLMETLLKNGVDISQLESLPEMISQSLTK